MRKLLCLAAAVALSFAVVPSASNASSQCPGIDDNPRNALAAIPHGETRPASPFLDERHPVLSIESGTLLPTYVKPGNSTDYTSVTGFRNLGEAGCLGYCLPMNVLCAHQVENGVVATNYLTPNATGLQVVVINYRNDIDSYPDPGCLHFNGSPGSTCKNAGDVVLKWTLQPPSPFHSDAPRFISSVITIPATATSVTAWALVETLRNTPNATKFFTTYTKLSA
jgi:hypothetical protein